MQRRQSITKRRIAEIQLHRAVQLLEDEADPISALTLAGAAEEILGKMVERKGLKTAFDDWCEFDRSFWDFAIARAKQSGKVVTPPNDKTLKQNVNATRNQLKLNCGGKNVRVEAMFRYDAEDMILRAIRNYMRLYDRLPRDQRVIDWWTYITD